MPCEKRLEFAARICGDEYDQGIASFSQSGPELFQGFVLLVF